MNANFNEEACLSDFQNSANNNLGLNQTFYKSAVIFTLIGMIFGWPYALHHFSALQWINTSLWKRVLRMVLGLAITVGVQVFFTWCVSSTNDIATMYFFGYAVPYFVNSFFIFGLYPIICTWIGLVQEDQSFAT